MTKTKTLPFDGSIFLTDPADQADVLNDAFESGHAGVVALALRDIAKAQGMTEVAKKVGITRAGLYKALSGDGDPKLSTFVALLRALDINLVAKAASRDVGAAMLEKLNRVPRQNFERGVLEAAGKATATPVKPASAKVEARKEWATRKTIRRPDSTNVFKTAADAHVAAKATIRPASRKKAPAKAQRTIEAGHGHRH